MNILLIPRVVVYHNNQIEFSVDKKWYEFMNFIFSNSRVLLPYDSVLKRNKIDLIVIGGGNDLPSIKKNKSNTIRQKITTMYFNYGLKNKIPIIGVCYGFQFIAAKCRCEVKALPNHTKSHNIIYKDRVIRVNSYHNFGVTKLRKNLINLAQAGDKSVELFIHRSKKILGIMWHPERYRKFKKFDKDLINKFLSDKL